MDPETMQRSVREILQNAVDDIKKLEHDPDIEEAHRTADWILIGSLQQITQLVELEDLGEEVEQAFQELEKHYA